MQYAPKCIYEDISSTLEALTEQSKLLNSSISEIQEKCSNLEFISETQIDQLIDLIRNYTLIKEVCLEKSSKILPNMEYTSIPNLSCDVERHQENSVKILNEVLYYAYEFLKIHSKNVITDSLLQDHKEKLQNIINSMLNEFVNIDDIIKQLEPYKIAILYITKNLTDLTQYAEILNNNFGAILFYNIISGNNLEYDADANLSVEEPSIEEVSEEVAPIEEPSVEEVSEEVAPTEEPSVEEVSEEVASTEEPSVEEVSEKVASTEEPSVEEVSEKVASTEEPSIEEVSEEVAPTEEPSIEEASEEVAPTEETISLYEKIVASITDKTKYSNVPTYNQDSFNEEVALNTICDYIISKNFACASMLFREYSKVSKSMQTLYNEYGLAVGDPYIKCDYGDIFLNSTIEPLHSWLQLSTLFREMFTNKYKSSKCYNYMSYMSSLIQNLDVSIVSKIESLSDMLSVFEEVGYNMDYLLGVNLFYQKNDITNSLRKQATEMLSYCEQSVSIWTHKGMIAVTKGLFSYSGGYVYYLIKEISLGNFKVMDAIKQYCKPFANEDGSILNDMLLTDKINNYLHELLINNKRNDTDINIGYRTKFANRFTHVLKFLFLCIEKFNAFDVNYVNENNISRYAKLKDTLNGFISKNLEVLHKNFISDNVSKMDKVGIICLAKTFEYIKDSLNHKISNKNYYYCDFLKTNQFILDIDYIPYINDTIDNISDFTIQDRVQRHIQDCKYINSWKDALKSQSKKCNVGSIQLITSYLKDMDLFTEDLQPYLDDTSTFEFNIESASNNFRYRIGRLYLNQSISGNEVLFKILDCENTLKEEIQQLCDYGFYNSYLEYLEKYALKTAEQEYNIRSNIINEIGNTIGYDSDYYMDIVKYTTDNLYGMADTLISMYFNNEEYPKVADNSSVQQYDEIFRQFTEFVNTYADELSSPNGYIFMNEFYERTIKPIVLERFSGSYDCVKSDELIDSWSKGQGTTNVVYDILTNIGFSIEKSIPIDNRTFKMVLSNYEKNNSQPYIIPENTIFLNGIYNIAQADRNLNSLNISEDTLIIMDYALNSLERKHILEVMGKISNGNKLIIADRCVIMFLTIIPSNIRKLALKICSLCNVSGSISYSANFRGDFIKNYIKQGGSNLLLGSAYYGKSYIVNTMADTLSTTSDNVVLKIDAINDNMSTPQLIVSACKDLELKINPFTDWATFETSMTRYINKHPSKKVYLLVDNADTFVQTCLEDKYNSPMIRFRKLSQQFKDRFKFILTCELSQEVIEYSTDLKLTCNILEPLNFNETITMFEDYFNASKVSINSFDIRVMLVSLALGNPKIVKLISKQILAEISNHPSYFNDTFNYELTQDVVYSALCNENFLKDVLSVFLNSVIDSKQSDSIIVPVLYGIVYYLYENSDVCTFSIENISKVLNIFDIDENSNLNIINSIKQLSTVGIVKSLNDTEYFLSHNAYRYYFGSKEFAFDMLDYSSKILKKEGMA